MSRALWWSWGGGAVSYERGSAGRDGGDRPCVASFSDSGFRDDRPGFQVWEVRVLASSGRDVIYNNI